MCCRLTPCNSFVQLRLTVICELEAYAARRFFFDTCGYFGSAAHDMVSRATRLCKSVSLCWEVGRMDTESLIQGCDES